MEAKKLEAYLDKQIKWAIEEHEKALTESDYDYDVGLSGGYGTAMREVRAQLKAGKFDN